MSITIEDPDLVEKDVIIHEFLDDGKRFLLSFFTADGSSIVRYQFDLIGLKNTEAMTMSSNDLTQKAYQQVAASDKRRKSNILSYSRNPIVKAIISIDHVFERGRTYQDIAKLTLKLKDGRRFEFSADSPPPYVAFMSISETAPFERLRG